MLGDAEQAVPALADVNEFVAVEEEVDTRHIAEALNRAGSKRVQVDVHGGRGSNKVDMTANAIWPQDSIIERRFFLTSKPLALNTSGRHVDLFLAFWARRYQVRTACDSQPLVAGRAFNNDLSRRRRAL